MCAETQSYNNCKYRKPPEGLEKVVADCKLSCFCPEVVKSGIFCVGSSYVTIPNERYCTECEHHEKG